MKSILFLCTGNSCRSQMAEGWGKHLLKEKFNFFSAGTKTHTLNPYAVAVMKEVGVDISNHYSKTLEEINSKDINIVITVCSDAHEACPYLPNIKTIHQGFDDPPQLTKNLTNEKEILDIYRRVRDEIKNYILTLEKRLK